MNQKTSKKNLAKANQNNVIAEVPKSNEEQYFAMASMAMQNGDMEQVKEMMALKREFEADEARKEFYKAFAEFKANAPVVTKDMKNSQYGGSKYTSRGHLVNTVSPVLSEHGLSTTWDILDQTPDSITIACVLTHALGHSISVKMSAPPDTGAVNAKGNYGKNPIQAIKSTKTYLEVATFESVTGTATSDYGDDDGNSYSATPVELISDQQALELHALITENNYKVDDWVRHFSNYEKRLQMDSLEDLPLKYFNRSLQNIKSAIKQAQQQKGK